MSVELAHEKPSTAPPTLDDVLRRAAAVEADPRIAEWIDHLLADSGGPGGAEEVTGG